MFDGCYQFLKCPSRDIHSCVCAKNTYKHVPIYSHRYTDTCASVCPRMHSCCALIPCVTQLKAQCGRHPLLLSLNVIWRCFLSGHIKLPPPFRKIAQAFTVWLFNQVLMVAFRLFLILRINRAALNSPEIYHFSRA